jgi:hypothetical protein
MSVSTSVSTKLNRHVALVESNRSQDRNRCLFVPRALELANQDIEIIFDGSEACDTCTKGSFCASEYDIGDPDAPLA